MNTKSDFKKQQGFTLIEIMIVVAIIAIITAIAVPSYKDSVRKSNRSDAMSAMLDTQQRLERCFSTYGSYTNANCMAAVALPITSTKAHYRVNATTRTASTYVLQATPISTEQVKDLKCTTFTLDNTGKKTATGTTAATCW
jgi:type IV pilus assembly protein PilE